MRASTERDDDRIEHFYLTQHRRLLAYLTRLVHDRSTAEDLCQEVFVKALRGWASRRSPATTTAWLYRIATNAAYDHLRRKRVARAPLAAAEHLSSSAPTPESRLDAAERVHLALARLPARYRTVLILHICQGYDLDEIAGALGCSHDALKMRLCRARARFQQVYYS